MTRRSPEQTRELILDAAERVFLRALPDAVGLRDIAREAGTSHALVTHYFGTYEGLTRATLERRIESMRRQAIERLARATFTPKDLPLLELLLDSVEDPVMVRLLAWALLTGRADALPGPPGALRPLLDAVEARARQLGHEPPPRAQLELWVTGTMAMAFGLAIARARSSGRSTGRGRWPARCCAGSCRAWAPRCYAAAATVISRRDPPRTACLASSPVAPPGAPAACCARRSARSRTAGSWAGPCGRRRRRTPWPARGDRRR